MPILPFLDHGLDHVPLRYLEDVRYHDVPALGGAYVLLAGPGNTFPYPRRRSSVFYIGKASNLHRRLTTHARFVRQASYDRQLTL